MIYVRDDANWRAPVLGPPSLSLSLWHTHTHIPAHAHARTHLTESASTSEGPRDVLSEEQLLLLVWTRWVVRMLPYYRAHLRGVQQTWSGVKWKQAGCLTLLFTGELRELCKISKLLFLFVCTCFIWLFNLSRQMFIKLQWYWCYL